MINMDFLSSANSTSKIQVTSDFNALATHIDFLNDTFMDLIPKNNELQNKVRKLVGQVHSLEKDLAHLQQYGCRENVEITGIPESVRNENLLNYILLLFSKIGMGNLTRESLHGWHRLKKKNRNKPANVIVRFVNRQDAYDALERRKLLKGIPGHQNIYIIENLCPKYQEIFDKCNELKRDHCINRAWTYNGIVHYKTSNQQNSRGKKVFHMDDLDAVFPPAFTAGFPPPRASPPVPSRPPFLMDLAITPPSHLIPVVPDAPLVERPLDIVAEPNVDTAPTNVEITSRPLAETSNNPVAEISDVTSTSTDITGTVALAESTESVAAVLNSTPPFVDETDELQHDNAISPPVVISCSPQQYVKLCPRASSDDSNVPSEDEEVSDDPIDISPSHTSHESTASDLTFHAETETNDRPRPATLAFNLECMLLQTSQREPLKSRLVTNCHRSILAIVSCLSCEVKWTWTHPSL